MGNKRRGERHDAEEAPTPSAKAENDGQLREEIQLRAYYLYCERGCEPGREVEDWLTAEQNVLAKQRSTRSSPSRR